MAELGLGAVSQRTDVTTGASVLASTLEWHASSWDSLRTFLLPRMMRVYPSHLAAVWQTYLRLAVIDLALRVAAQLHLTHSPEETLDFLEWIPPGRRGAYLNRRRKRAGVILADFVEWVGVWENAAEGWLYRGVRPSDENLGEIAKALTRNGADGDCQRTVRELRLLYWVSDMAETLGKHIGAGAVEEIVNRLQRYALLAYRTIRDSMTQARSTDIDELAARGAHSSLAGPLVRMLGSQESDKVWQEDLAAVGSGWIGRVSRGQPAGSSDRGGHAHPGNGWPHTRELGCRQRRCIRTLPAIHGVADEEGGWTRPWRRLPGQLRWIPWTPSTTSYSDRCGVVLARETAIRPWSARVLRSVGSR